MANNSACRNTMCECSIIDSEATAQATLVTGNGASHLGHVGRDTLGSEPSGSALGAGVESFMINQPTGLDRPANNRPS